MVELLKYVLNWFLIRKIKGQNLDIWEIMKKLDSIGIDFKLGKGIFFFKV